jgi:hypothetical protein
MDVEESGGGGGVKSLRSFFGKIPLLGANHDAKTDRRVWSWSVVLGPRS